MQIKDVMRTPVHLIGPDAPLVAAARRMRDENVGSLPVGGGALRRDGENCAKTAVRGRHVGRAALLLPGPAGRGRRTAWP